MANAFYSICKRRKLKVNVEKSKVMVFMGEREVIDFNTAYRVSLPAGTRTFWDSAVQAWGYGKRNNRASYER